ncbi:unnamed protein product [Sphagnum jensenii]|uniref:Putative rRNA methyltransferase n=1 Tax=Sphagnum jensenii TaxID=128206 RepID=A0ABP0WU55_9BRYO
MGKSKTTGKGRLDRFYYLAKEQGFRSRAAFKLVQLDRKFQVLSSARSVLDLCAAPGGWMQVAAKNMPVGSLIIGIDLVPIRPIRGAITLQEDITTPQCRAAIKKVLRERQHDMVQVVLHDGSPNVGGAWAKESSAQTALVLDSLKLATEFLAPGGTFITKVFRSQDYNALLFAFKQFFEKVEVTKPVASRATSAEIYVICLKYRAPAKIDPRLLDARHLFKEIVEPPKVVDVLKGSKQKRHREGYEEGKTTLFKEVPMSDFVWAEKPLDMLGSITSITFSDPGSDSILKHPLTTEEIKILCEDLRVLGKSEFKQLLKWRLLIRKALQPSEDKPATTETAADEKAGEEEGDEDDLAMMEELTEIAQAKRRKERKKRAKAKEKAKARTATGMQVDVMEDGVADTDLFALSAIKAKKDLVRIEDAEAIEDVEDTYSSSDEMLNGGHLRQDHSDDDSDIDPDEERQRYDQELDEYLERAYDKYCSTTDGSTKRRKRARLAGAEVDGELWQETESGGMDKDDESEKSDDDEEENPLVVPLAENLKPSKDHLAQQWFSQDVFSGIDAVEELSDDEKVRGQGQKSKGLKVHSSERLDDDDDDLDDEMDAVITGPTSNGFSNGDHHVASQVENDDFEIVPAEASASSDSDTSEDSDQDSDTGKAEILAYAKKMLRKKSRESIIDAAYNRYTFNDVGLPRWFADDERKHSQPMKPITKDEVEAMKAQFRSINARPVKKVAEAKARKKKRAQKKLEQVRQKATAIADQEDLSATSKNKAMERLYSKALAVPKKPKAQIVVAKKGVGARGGKGRVVVDRRLKKDSRAKDTGKPGKGFKGRGGGKARKSGGGKKGQKGPKAKGPKAKR